MMTKVFLEFLKTEKAAGIILIICTAVSLSLANSSMFPVYSSFWQTMVLGHSLAFWINDVLMTFFFLLVGLEIEREIYVGELSQPRKALLPIIAALGGMLGPAALHFSFNAGSVTQAGFGIPMATDIAFSLGVLSLLGNRVPFSLKVFLTALAIVDDLGAITVIALFYTASLSFVSLAIAVGIIALLFLFNRRGIRNIWVYLISGIAMWYFIHESGIHSTITGVILAFLVPFGKGDGSSPSYRLQHALHYVVAFVILPLFALANTVVPINSSSLASLLLPNGIGIMAGLMIGNPIGISLLVFAGVKLRICTIPSDISWKHLLGVSFLAGIGFTMSIFITMLAFHDPQLIEQSKVAILAASLFSGLIGYSLLFFLTRDTVMPSSDIRTH